MAALCFIQICISVSRANKHRDTDTSLIPLAWQIDLASKMILRLTVQCSKVIPAQFLFIGRNPLCLIQTSSFYKRLKAIPDLLRREVVQ